MTNYYRTSTVTHHLMGFDNNGKCVNERIFIIFLGTILQKIVTKLLLLPIYVVMKSIYELLYMVLHLYLQIMQ